jgi:hypothetical protein
MGKGFCSAIKEMQNRHWANTRHLWCRWHIYNAIKRKCADYFKQHPKGEALKELNRFINGFKNIVCAPNEGQMKALWESFCVGAGGAPFPEQALNYVKANYYNSRNAKQFMECYVYDSGNLGQTTTSANEGNHYAFRTNTSVIDKPTESYKLRRIHKKQLMQQLRARAQTAYSRIPLDIRGIPELRQLVGKISIFALTQIKQQIVLAKKENLMGNILEPLRRCHCHAFMQYQLLCIHMIPTDGSPISFESISPFWHLSNWDNSLLLDLNSLTIRYCYTK